MNFFGLPASSRPAIHEEIFALLYYGNGGFTHNEVYNMPVYLRRFNIKLLEKAIKQQNESQQKSASKSKGISRPNIG